MGYLVITLLQICGRLPVFDEVMSRMLYTRLLCASTLCVQDCYVCVPNVFGSFSDLKMNAIFGIVCCAVNATEPVLEFIY